MRILIIHGPNLNLLEKRNNKIYGQKSLVEINKLIERKAIDLNIEVEIFQSNHEGSIIDKIHESIESGITGLIINPAALTHYSIAIRDAIEILDMPVIEVHISNIYSREGFRSKSVIAPVCKGQISGLGVHGYLLAMDSIIELSKEK